MSEKNYLCETFNHEEDNQKERQSNNGFTWAPKEEHADNYRQDSRHQLKPEVRYVLRAYQTDTNNTANNQNPAEKKHQRDDTKG